MSALIALVLLTSSIAANDAERILAFFPTPSLTHQVVFRPLTQELAKRGHLVTVITPNPAFPRGEAPENMTEIDVRDVSLNKWRTLKKLYSNETDPKMTIKIPFLMLIDIVEMQLCSETVQEALARCTYDLLFLEATVKPALILSHLVQAPVILVSYFGSLNFNVQTMGSAWHPFLYPDSLSKRLHITADWEGCKELWNSYELENTMQEVEVAENYLSIKMFGRNAPMMKELKDNVHMLFLNTYPIWEGNRPVPPSVVYIGGINQSPEKKLPTDVQKYLDSSRYGVIYLSFGANVPTSLVPSERIQLMVKVFSELPYDVLWMWDKDKFPGCYRNITIFKSLPQSDLLRHPNVKAFITQGNLQSTEDAITGGVPLIGVPMFGDHWFNTEKYKQLEIGVQLDWDSLTEENLTKAINTVIHDKRYHENILKLGDMMRDQPQTALERAVWWTEYVLRHSDDAKHLRARSANMSWWQYLEMDVVVYPLKIASGMIFIFALLLCHIRTFCVVYKLYKEQRKR